MFSKGQDQPCLLIYYSTSLSLPTVCKVRGSRRYPEPDQSQRKLKGLLKGSCREATTQLWDLGEARMQKSDGLARSPLYTRISKGSKFLSPAASSQHHPCSLGIHKPGTKMSTVSESKYRGVASECEEKEQLLGER